MKMSSNLFKTINSKYLYVILLLVFLRIDLGFLSTLPTGGDMGAHIVPTNYFVENFFQIFNLEDGQMIGLLVIRYITSIFLYHL